MKNIIIALLLLCMLSQTAYARYCTNPSCAMCNRIFGIMEVRSTSIHKPIYTPTVVVDKMLGALDLGPKDLLYDIGCGDARVLIAAVKKYNCRGVGIEIDARIASIARGKVSKANLTNKIRITTGDAKNFNLKQATAIFVYLYPDLLTELASKMPISTKIVSYMHKIPNHLNRKILAGKNSKAIFYVTYDVTFGQW